MVCLSRKIFKNFSKFLKAVFHKLYLVHSSILCPICTRRKFKNTSRLSQLHRVTHEFIALYGRHFTSHGFTNFAWIFSKLPQSFKKKKTPWKTKLLSYIPFFPTKVLINCELWPWSLTVSWMENTKYRSSCSQIFFTIGVLTNSANFTGKHFYWILFLMKFHHVSRPGL